jgi:GntR family transcriptional regulator
MAVFSVNFKSGTPVYLQLVDQVRTAAATGALRPGEALPGIRPLAEALRVNRNTVAKAYTELESQGVIETLAGKGCFVRENQSPLKKDVRRRLIADTLEHAAVQAHHLQIERDEFIRIAEQRYDGLADRRARPHAGSRP